MYLDRFILVGLFLLPALTERIAHDPPEHDAIYVNNLVKLRKDLFKDYDVHSRPVLNNAHTVNITVGFSATMLTEVDESKGTMNIDGWFWLSWNDPHFQWKPEDYDSISVLRLPNKHIWTPDLKMYQGRSDAKDFAQDSLALVYNSGTVMWVPPSTMHTTCDFTKGYVNYPLDTHNCSAKIGSWTYDGINMDLLLSETNSQHTGMKDYADVHAGWSLTSITSRRDVMHYSCCEEPYVSITFNMELKRKGSENVASGIILSVGGVLVLAMFWLPVTSGWKFSLSLVALMLDTWSSIEIVKLTPSAAALPYALQSVKSSMIITVIAIVVEVIILSMATCTARSPPALMSSFLRSSFVSRCLCFCSPNESSPSEAIESEMTKSDPVDPRRREWQALATACDRFAFVFFLVVFLATAAI